MLTPETQALHSLPPAAREALAQGTGPGWAIGTNPDGSPYQRVYSSPAEWMRCRARARGTVGAPLNGVVGWAWLPADTAEILAVACNRSNGAETTLITDGDGDWTALPASLKKWAPTGRLAALHLLAAVWPA